MGIVFVLFSLMCVGGLRHFKNAIDVMGKVQSSWVNVMETCVSWTRISCEKGMYTSCDCHELVQWTVYPWELVIATPIACVDLIKQFVGGLFPWRFGQLHQFAGVILENNALLGVLPPSRIYGTISSTSTWTSTIWADTFLNLSMFFLMSIS